MCRPAPESCRAAGTCTSHWCRSDGAQRLRGRGDDGDALAWVVATSRDSSHHARAASVFAMPTVNGYKRYRAVLPGPGPRALGLRQPRRDDPRGRRPEDRAIHVENRVGEPAANPYLAIAAQLLAGLDGVDRGLDPGPSADEPYETTGPRGCPRSLREAMCALDDDPTRWPISWARARRSLRAHQAGRGRPFRGGGHRLGAAGVLRPVLISRGPAARTLGAHCVWSSSPHAV